MKYILKYSNLALIALFAILISGCELDEGSKGFVSPEAYYSTESGVNKGLIGLYAYYTRNLGDANLFKDKLTAFTGADDLTSPATKSLFTEADLFYVTGGNANIQVVWQMHYRAIMACNEFIEKVDPNNFSESFYNNAIGNARFLRGKMYLELTNIFGDIPMMLSSSVDEDIEKTSVSTILKEVVIPDLEFAKENVINQDRDTPSGVNARVINASASKTAAKAYLAKAYMALAGWPSKEDTPENWAKVKENTAAIINEGAYGLLDDYAHNFGYLGEPGSSVQPWEGNEEAIWSRICNANQAAFYGTRSRYYGAFWLEWMDFYLEWHFYERIPEGYRKGFSTTSDTNWEYLDFTKWPYCNTYSHPTIMKFFWGGMNWDIYRKARGLSRSAKSEDHPEYIGFEHDYENSSDIPEMRYAEVLLMYAEACARTNTDVDDGIEKLNWVRRRAYAEGLPAVKDTIANAIAAGTLGKGYWKNENAAVDYPQESESDLIKAILDERSFEFIGELGGVRWFDLKRLEMVDIALQSRDDRELDLIGNPSDQSGWNMPIPASEFSYNDNLE